MMRILSALLLALVLAGCATSGSKITQSQLSQVAAGKTTRSDLIAMFGAPIAEVYNADGTQVLSWGYAHVGFLGIGTEIQGLSMIIGPDGTVSGYSRSGSVPQPTAFSQPPAPVAQAAPSGQPLGKEQWKQQQLDQLNRETGLSYEEYQRRYRAITGQ